MFIMLSNNTDMHCYSNGFAFFFFFCVLSEMKHHQDVCNFLEDLEILHLRKLGGALGVSYGKCQKFSDSGGFVASWLRKEDDVLEKSGRPTWSSLVSTLKKIGQTGIANDIMKKHAKKVQQCRVSRNIDQSSSSSGSSTGVHSVRNDTGRSLWEYNTVNLEIFVVW